ncbi:hypothetical protein AB0A73_24665 [Glycomyces sp. NPDC047369]
MLTLIGICLVRLRNNIHANPGGDNSVAQVLDWGESAKEIKNMISRSREMWIWGGAFTEHLQEMEPNLIDEFNRGLIIRLLMVERKSSAVKDLAFRLSKPPKHGWNDFKSEVAFTENIQLLEERLKVTIRTLDRMLKTIPSESLEYRTLGYLAPYSIYICDPYSPSGRLLVRLAFHSGRHDRRVTIKIRRSEDPELYNYFLSEFLAVWDAAGGSSTS